MKRIFLFLFVLLLTLTLKAQQKLSYTYDAAGNRVGRTIVREPRSASVSETPVDTVLIIAEALDERQIRIYPNPVEFQMTIKISGNNTSAIQGEYSLYDITGVMVAKRRITGETTLVDMSRHSRGIYLLQILLDGKPTTLRVIKK